MRLRKLPKNMQVLGQQLDPLVDMINNNAKTSTEVKSGLNLDAFPKHWLYKVQTQTKMGMVILDFL